MILISSSFTGKTKLYFNISWWVYAHCIWIMQKNKLGMCKRFQQYLWCLRVVWNLNRAWKLIGLWSPNISTSLTQHIHFQMSMLILFLELAKMVQKDYSLINKVRMKEGTARFWAFSGPWISDLGVHSQVVKVICNLYQGGYFKSLCIPKLLHCKKISNPVDGKLHENLPRYHTF